MKEISDYQNSPSEPGRKRGIQTGKAVGHEDENPRRTVTRKEQGSKKPYRKKKEVRQASRESKGRGKCSERNILR